MYLYFEKVEVMKDYLKKYINADYNKLSEFYNYIDSSISEQNNDKFFIKSQEYERHKELLLSFKYKIALITGNRGSGKTTFVNSIFKNNEDFFFINIDFNTVFVEKRTVIEHILLNEILSKISKLDPTITRDKVKELEYANNPFSTLFELSSKPETLISEKIEIVRLLIQYLKSKDKKVIICLDNVDDLDNEKKSALYNFSLRFFSNLNNDLNLFISSNVQLNEIKSNFSYNICVLNIQPINTKEIIYKRLGYIFTEEFKNKTHLDESRIYGLKIFLENLLHSKTFDNLLNLSNGNVRKTLVLVNELINNVDFEPVNSQKLSNLPFDFILSILLKGNSNTYDINKSLIYNIFKYPNSDNFLVIPYVLIACEKNISIERSFLVNALGQIGFGNNEIDFAINDLSKNELVETNKNEIKITKSGLFYIQTLISSPIYLAAISVELKVDINTLDSLRLRDISNLSSLKSQATLLTAFAEEVLLTETKLLKNSKIGKEYVVTNKVLETIKTFFYKISYVRDIEKNDRLLFLKKELEEIEKRALTRGHKTLGDNW